MLFLVFMSVMAAAVAGLIVKYVLDRMPKVSNAITWKEFGIGLALISVVVAPGVTKLGWEMVRSDTVTFNEYWNGWELAAPRQDIQCTRDGSCRWDYDCDPYTVRVSYECGSSSGTGKNRRYVSKTCYRNETRYHSCPYVSVEFSYFIKTTLGDYTIDKNRFPESPQQHRWRSSERIPESVIQRAGVGEPPFWRAASDRVRSGRPGPVTTRNQYNNYVLASDRTILKQYSVEIARFQKMNILPAVQFGVHDFYLADKAYFIGYRPVDLLMWQNAVSYLNAALGSELQGDLHLVLIQNDEVTKNPDVYAQALRAWWLNKEAQDRNAFAKNSIGVVVGTTDGRTVAWARAFTGMPIGNESLAVAIRNRLKGVLMTPAAVVGSVQGGFKTPTQVQSIHTSGVIESVLWGLADPQTKFRRYSMGGKNDQDGFGGGYLYLWGEIQPKPNQKFWIWFVTFLAAGVVWFVAAAVGENFKKRRMHWREI